MTQIYTPNFLKSFQSNLQPTKLGAEPSYCYDPETDLTNYDEYYFQVLIFEPAEGPAKLVYGTKKALQNTFNLDPSSLPTPGAMYLGIRFTPLG